MQVITLKKTVSGEGLRNVILCSSPLFFMIIFHSFNIFDIANTQSFMMLGLLLVAVYGIYLAYNRKLSAYRVVSLVIIAGVIMRSGYTIYTHVFTRCMDMNRNNPNGTGHWGYLYHVLHGHLPPSNEYQFYHPPLYYIVSAIFLRTMEFFTGADIENNLDNYLYMAQTVSCIASCITLIAFSKIMDELKIRKSVQIIPMAIMAFYPVNCLIAGRMNNDSLTYMFMLLALYFTAKWHNEQKMSYIIGIAITLGCGMMTKLNAALAAFVIGPVMIYHFIKCIIKKDGQKIKRLVMQFAVFTIIVVPLGLWYPIRNYIVFNQPITYLYKATEHDPMYTGRRSFYERWVQIPFNYFKQPFCAKEDASVWMRFIKTGMHGEFTWKDISSFSAWGSDYIHALLIVLGLVSLVFTMFKDKDVSFAQKTMTLWVWIVSMVSFIKFNIDFPFAFTSDMRYMILWILAEGAFIGFFADYCYKRRKKPMYKGMLVINVMIVILFCSVSVIKFL